MPQTTSSTAQTSDRREATTFAFGLRELRAVTQRFQTAAPRTAAWQRASTILPLLALLAAMHAGLALAPALPTAGLVVRLFALQHDCGHGSLFRTPRVNDFVGRLCSLFTFTPYGHWRLPVSSTSSSNAASAAINRPTRHQWQGVSQGEVRTTVTVVQ
jgi:acyl-lipid omega-6 desaturase (Delta-12 desaturase)